MCEPYSFEAFKQYMWLSYLQFTDNRPHYELTYISNTRRRNITNSSFKTFTSRITRNVEFVERTYEEFENHPSYGNLFMLEKYFQLRMIEEDVQLTRMEYKFAMREIKRDLKDLSAYEAANTLARIIHTRKKQKRKKSNKKTLTFGNSPSKMKTKKGSPSKPSGGY
jgi:hypothetical protein